MSKNEFVNFDFRPEHQIRSDLFSNKGLQLLHINFPSIKATSHDGMDRIVCFWPIFSKYMAANNQFDIAEDMEGFSKKADEESASRSEQVFLLYENDESIIQQAISALTSLATQPAFTGTLIENSDRIMSNEDIFESEKFLFKAAPVFVFNAKN